MGHLVPFIIMAKFKSNSNKTTTSPLCQPDPETTKIATDIVNDMKAEGILDALLEGKAEGVEIIFSDSTVIYTPTDE